MSINVPTVELTDLDKQLLRVDIAGEQLQKAGMTKTKKAAEILGVETKILLSSMVGEIKQLKAELKQIREGSL